MTVDVYHADALVPLSERLELAFSLDRDTYSGASPAYNLPSNMVNQMTVKGKYANIVSSASPLASAGMLTTMGPTQFEAWQQANQTLQTALDQENEAKLAQFKAQYDAVLAEFSGGSGSVTQTVTDDFSAMRYSAYAGDANVQPLASGNCPGQGQSGCYYQNGLVFGAVSDPADPTVHFHRDPGVDGATYAIGYHSDSDGIYVRAQDGGAFSFNSVYFSAPISDGNPIYGSHPTTDSNGVLQPDGSNKPGANEQWEIVGFSNAVNPNLSSGDGIHYSDQVAIQTVPNGYNGELKLSSAFDHVDAVWIHYDGYPSAPQNGILFGMSMDEAQFSTAAPPSPQNNPQVAAAYQTYQQELAQQAAYVQRQNYLDTVAAYRKLLDSSVPSGSQTVQVMQTQPLETRSQPQFTGRYYFDDAILSLSGGFSREPDYLSNFGSAQYSHQLNNKLTTLNFGYGMVDNSIWRNTSMMNMNTAAMAAMSGPQYNPANYPTLNGHSVFNNLSFGLSQVLDKDTVFQSSVNFSVQNGYLSNPYKEVYIRGILTPEDYAAMAQNYNSFNWNSITNLQVVGVELFRENRPNQRNTWSFSNQLNHFMPNLDATLHADYRFYTDDWSVNSHTFQLKWLQNLGDGWLLTPSVRYYSQSQAFFFAPYYLSPRADNLYSSDYRLSGYGDLSGGVSIGKTLGKGVRLDASLEYVQHAGGLKLGGGGSGNYADFDYYFAHANLNVDLSAPVLDLDAGGQSHHQHRRHGAHAPAGVMFSHMIPADQWMLGYRYQYSGQDGGMQYGDTPVGKQAVAANGCPGRAGGCVYAPTVMTMQMHMLDFMYAPSDSLNLMLMPQLMSMDMTMSPSLTGKNDLFMNESYMRHTGNNLGDTFLTALVKLWESGSEHVHLGLGLSAPTGNVNLKMNQQYSLDYGMQTGSGTWDFKPSVTYSDQEGAWNWGAQFSGVKRMQYNKYHYAFGDIFQATGWGGYQIFDWLNGSLRLLFTDQARIQGESSHVHLTTSTVDYTSNYGGRFLDLGFGLNTHFSEGKFAGHNLSFEWLQPVATDFNGYQLSRSGGLALTWSYAF